MSDIVERAALRSGCDVVVLGASFGQRWACQGATRTPTIQLPLEALAVERVYLSIDIVEVSPATADDAGITALPASRILLSSSTR